MPRLSKLLEKLEDQAIGRFGGWYDRHKEKFTFYIPAGLILWYVYGLFLNSLRLGIEQTFHDPNHEIVSIWVWNPFRNLLAVFTPFGLVTTLVIVLLTCLIMKKGYSRFSGYKYTHDSRGFDILPDATHGSSGFLTEKEMRAFLELARCGT